jgi:long-chain acyl-CoA synthetase
MEYYQGSPLRNVGNLPAMGAHRYGDKTAFLFHGQETSYDELEAGANEIANVLVDNGVTPGDRVGLFVPNQPLFPLAYFGAIKAGAVAVPLNLRMDPETLGFVVDDAGIDHLVGSPFLAEEVQNLAAAAGVGTVYLAGVSDDGVVNLSHARMDADDRFPTAERAYDDVACQPYTSGTTGRPKGVLLTHENLLSAIEGYSNGALGVDPDDALLLVLPLFHIYGLNALMGSYLYRGAEMVLQPEPEGEAMLDAVDERGVTKFAGVPAMYTMMYREYREDPDRWELSTLEDCTCAASPLAEDTRRTIEQAWDVPIIEGWGMTETAPAGTLEPANGVRKEAGCIGPPVPNVELKVVDPDTRETRVGPEDLSPRGMADPRVDFGEEDAVTGELAVRGDNVFEGYHGRPEATRQAFDDDGWFYTKDVARVDSDGYFWMVDRADDMILVGGNNVYPAEVENALYEHADVAEAAVVAAPHEVKGEAPVAFVVLEPGAEVSETELRRFTLDHVATYAHPRRVFFVEELPRSATQKVQRYRLEDDVDEYLDAPLTSSDEEL